VRTYMRNSRDHLGARFEVWTGESTWFWHVFNPHNNGGAVGVAATEADAIREACMAIEERCTSGCETTSSARLIIDLFFEPIMGRRARRIWTSSLQRLAEYVATA
jgi:hypothetical protein